MARKLFLDKDEDKLEKIGLEPITDKEVKKEVRKSAKKQGLKKEVVKPPTYAELLGNIQKGKEDQNVIDKDRIARSKKRQLLGDTVGSLVNMFGGIKKGTPGVIRQKDTTPWDRIAQEESDFESAFRGDTDKYNKAILSGAYEEERRVEAQKEEEARRIEARDALMADLKRKSSEKDLERQIADDKFKKEQALETRKQDFVEGKTTAAEALAERKQSQSEGDFTKTQQLAKDKLQLERDKLTASQASEANKLTGVDKDGNVNFAGEASFKTTKDFMDEIRNEAVSSLGGDSYTGILEELRSSGVKEPEKIAQDQVVNALISTMRQSGISQDDIVDIMQSGDINRIRNTVAKIPEVERVGGFKNFFNNLFSLRDRGVEQQSNPIVEEVSQEPQSLSPEVDNLIDSFEEISEDDGITL